MRRQPLALWIAAATGYAFLYIPLVIVVAYSFNDSRLNAEWVGFTFGWYDKLFHNEEMLTAAGNSLFIALAAMDIGTAFGSLGARREMFIGFLAEPALLMVLFTASLLSGSTSLPTIVDTLAHREFAIYPSLAFAGVAFTMVSLAENARIPVDNPTTHLELTMIHEAMILEYSARHLALIEWASALKLFNFSCIGLALFLPLGIAQGNEHFAIVPADRKAFDRTQQGTQRNRHLRGTPSGASA